MDDRRFDALVKAMAIRRDRRLLLKGLLGMGSAAVVSGALLDSGAEAARRPTPTPKPVKCPGTQTWNGTACVCTSGISCGPDCCTGGAICCDHACCSGECYGEERCCPANSSVCNGECGPWECCTDDQCIGTSVCDPDQHVCVCVPDCDGLECGDDSCGGSCGTCSGQDACQNGQCVCQPHCTGVTGSDGCGGACQGCDPNGNAGCLSDTRCQCFYTPEKTYIWADDMIQLSCSVLGCPKDEPSGRPYQCVDGIMCVLPCVCAS